MSAALTNEEWICRLCSGGDAQHEALESLRTFLLAGLLSAYRNKGIDETFCEDVAQEAVIKVLDKIDQFAGRSKFTTWAMTIAIRLAVSQLRSKQFKNVSLAYYHDGEQQQIEIATTPAESLGMNDERQSILLTLKELIDTQLTEKQRIAIKAGLGGMPVEEIAKRTESNRNAVYKLIHDSRQRLKQGMLQAGFSWTDIQTAFA